MKDRKLKRFARWSAVALWLGCVSLAAEDVPPRDRHYQAARAALAEGDTTKAKLELKLSLQDNPQDGKSHYLLASLLGREGDLDQAIVGFEQAATLEPNNADARYNLGTAMLWRSEPVAAARLLEDALTIDPDHVPTYNNLGKAYLQAGIPELAVACYAEALRRDPSSPVALKNLALLTGTPGVPKPPAPGAGKPIAEPGEQKPPATPDAGAAATVAEAKPASPAEAPARPAADRQISDEMAAAVQELQALVYDLPHVTAEARGSRLALTGWTSGPAERKLLDRVLAARKDVLDLTGEDVGDSQRLIEVDAIIFKITGFDAQTVGHNFLRRVEINASVSNISPFTPGMSAAFEWLFSAAINYEVNIANASEQQVAFLARPHLTTVSGAPASFIAGGDIVFQVSGLNSGDIKPYPFGTTLEVTPTLLRTVGEDGTPRVRLSVKAGRRVFLTIQDLYGTNGTGSAIFENISVSSEAVVGLNQTLILTGLNQRERRTSKTGVPGLRSVPIIKYLFSENVITTSDLAIVILLTPRDPAFWDEQNRKTTAAFLERRRAFIQAVKGTDDDMRRFKERYPDWYKLVPNRLSSHFYLLEKSEAYRKVNGVDLADESLRFDPLAKLPEKTSK